MIPFNLILPKPHKPSGEGRLLSFLASKKCHYDERPITIDRCRLPSRRFARLFVQVCAADLERGPCSHTAGVGLALTA